MQPAQHARPAGCRLLRNRRYFSINLNVQVNLISAEVSEGPLSILLLKFNYTGLIIVENQKHSNYKENKLLLCERA